MLCARTRPKLSGRMPSRMYSTYASSMAIRMCAGTASTKRASASGPTTVEVGLLGLHTKISRVRSVTAASMA
ncbi:Uncharacterised protein [Mycobacterium tuberculosis]|uniref:Uncharacterized protein n=1 Tax=Mycobacterium tuberculosis TaxID=1773 RepID=A0A654T919_MYCTX|nr:Uncharacterised protein [Mycobacterium tuberculosis]